MRAFLLPLCATTLGGCILLDPIIEGIISDSGTGDANPGTSSEPDETTALTGVIDTTNASHTADATHTTTELFTTSGVQPSTTDTTDHDMTGTDTIPETTIADTTTETTGDETTGAPIDCPARLVGKAAQLGGAFWDPNTDEIVLVGNTDETVEFGGSIKDPNGKNVMYVARITESSAEVDLDTVLLGLAGCDGATLAADGRLFAVSNANSRLFMHRSAADPPWDHYMLPAGHTAYGVAASATRVAIAGVCASWPGAGDRWIETRAFANLAVSIDSPCLAPNGIGHAAHLAVSEAWLAGDRVDGGGRDAILHRVVFPDQIDGEAIIPALGPGDAHVFRALAGDANTIYAVGLLGGDVDVVNGAAGDLAFASIEIDDTNPQIWAADVGAPVAWIRTLAVHGDSLYFAGTYAGAEPFVGRMSTDGVGPPILASITGHESWTNLRLYVDVAECGLLLAGHATPPKLPAADLTIAGQTALTVVEADAGNSVFAVFLPFDFT